VNIVVFGAAGRTGRLVVERALGHGHAVTAFVHTTALDLDHPRLTAVAGDVLDFEAVSSAVEGQAGVAFVLSGASSHEPGIANVIHAMALHEVRRLSAVSAAGAFAHNDTALSFAYRTLINTVMRAGYEDLEKMEQRIEASDLDWTIVRPMGLTDGPATGQYRVSLDGAIPPKPKSIARADVAALLLKALETDTYLRRAVVIAQ
jgi:putative NADH-flavin reductase